MGRTWRVRAAAASAGVCVVTATIVSAPVASADDLTGTVEREVIATGLDNPRGLFVDRDGVLFVAEAGSGGGGPCASGPEGAEVCFGTTGAVTRITKNNQNQIITGLPSVAEEGGFAAIGPARVEMAGGKLFVLVANPGGGPQTREQFGPDAANLGKLLRFAGGRSQRAVADFPVFEAAENPDGGAGAPPGGEIDSNPYGLLAGNRHLVTDAGGNDLLQVDSRGRVKVLATFPIQMVDAPPFLGLPPGTQIPSQSVPTSVTRGPDGAFYVSELTGFPFEVGSARVWRVVPGEELTVYATGFTNIVDLEFDRRGVLHVVEIAHNGLLSEDPTGALIRVDPGGDHEVLTTDLTAPGGLAFDRQNRAYVTNNSIFSGAGEVLRITVS